MVDKSGHVPAATFDIRNRAHSTLQPQAAHSGYRNGTSHRQDTLQTLGCWHLAKQLDLPVLAQPVALDFLLCTACFDQSA